MAYGNIRGITIEIDGDTSKLTTALKNVDKASRDTSRNLRDIKEALKYDKSKGPELAEQKQRELAKAIENTKSKLEILKQGQAEMTEEFKKTSEGQSAYDNLTREIWKTERQLKSFEAQSDKSYQKLAKLRDVATDFGKGAQELGSNLTKKVSLPIAGIAGAASKLAIDFDTAMVGVRKTTDLTDKEFEDMRQTILNMAKEMPASANEIASIVEVAGQLGIEKDSLIEFSKTVLDLGNATNLTAEEAANSFARFANITQMPQENFENLGSTVVELGNNLATNESEIVDLGTRLAAAGSQAGLTDAEIMGLAGAMSSVGLSAEAGGSAMSQVMTKIGEAVSTNSDKLDVFAEVAGMSAEEFSRAWQESPAQALESFISGLNEGKESGENLDLTLSELGITGLREKDTIKRLAGAGDLLGDSFDMANKAFADNNALNDEVARKYESVGAKLDIFKNKLEVLGITFGDKLSPYIEKATDLLGDFTDKISGADPEKLGIILGIGAVVAALGPMLWVVGKISILIGTVSGALGVLQGTMVGATPAMIGLASVMGVVKGAFSALKGLLIAHPVAAIVIGALTIAIPLIIQNWDAIKEFLTLAWENIKVVASNVWNGIKDTVANVWTGVTEAWALFWDPIGQWLAEKIQAMIDFVTPILETFKNIFIMLWMVIQEIFTTSWELISGFFRENRQAFVEMATIIFEGLKVFFETLWTGIKDTAIMIWTGIKETLSSIWNSLSEAVKPIFEGIKNFISGIWEGIKTSTSNIWNSIKTTISNIWNSIKSVISAAINAVSSTVSNIWNSIKSTTSNIWNSIKTNISNTWNGIKSVVNGAINAVNTTITNIWNSIKSTTSSIWNGIKSAIEIPINAAKSTASSAVEGIRSKLSGTFNSIKSTASSVWEGVKNSITRPMEAAASRVRDAMNRIKSIFNVRLQFPHIRLPHFRVSGGFSINPPSVPHFGIEWYKKGAIFTKPTLFNTPYGMKGVGEAGAEAVLPIEKLSSIMADAMNQTREVDAGITFTGNNFYIREEDDIEKVARKLYRMIESKKRGVGLG